VTVLVAPRPTAPSGGHGYNAAVLAHWPGTTPRLIEVDGPWPEGDVASHAALAAALEGQGAALVDGWVGAGAPQALEAAARQGTIVVLLSHLPIVAEATPQQTAEREAAERRSVRSASRVIATSHHAALDLARRYDRTDIAVVPPGVDEAAVADRHDPPVLLNVGSLCERKDQLSVIAALRHLDDLPWTARFVGPVADPAYADTFRRALGDRITWAGPLVGDEREAAYAGADLLVHPARHETWGMVVTEALARGIPAVVADGTGAVEALTSGGGMPGATVPAGDPDALAAVLRRWLTDSSMRDQWRRCALEARPRLRRWPDVARELASLVAGAR
jgi:glycosyltransferase involved in cell wall biosynthesis